MPPIPATVTRFYGNPRFALDLLENRQVALVRVTRLNDPFDPYGFLELDFDGYAGLLRHVRQSHPNDRPWFRMSVTAQSWGRAEHDLKIYMQRLRSHTFVLCASAPGDVHPKNNLYMWGHYGNGHRGLAVEFDTSALGLAALAHHSSQHGDPLVDGQPWVKIDYADSFRAISAEDVFQFMRQEHEIDAGERQTREQTSLDRYYQQLSVIKSRVWQPENEWRLMWRSDTVTGDVYKIPVTPECIKALYFGLAISPDDAERVADVATRDYPNAEIWRATKRHGDLALAFRRA
jgi:hypothetical protein